MKTMKKLTCVICLALGLLAPLQVQAENDQNANVGREVVVKYKNIERVSTTLQIQSDSAVCRVRLTSAKEQKISIDMCLQKYQSKKWVTVKKWSGEKTGTLYVFQKSASIAKGKYRVKASVRCGDESIVRFSSEKTN